MTITTTKIEGAHAKMRQDAQGDAEGRSPRRRRQTTFEELLLALAAHDAEQKDEAADAASEQVLDAVMYNQLIKRQIRAN